MPNSAYENLAARLDRYRRVRDRLRLGTSALRGLLALVAVAVLLLVLETLLWLPPEGRHALVWAGLVVSALVLAVFFFVPAVRLLVRKESVVELAYEVGERIPGVADRLGNALQVYEAAEQRADPVEKNLAGAGLEQAARLVQGVDFGGVADRTEWRRTLRLARWSAAGLLVLAVLAARPLAGG
ncbi:MAG TPA: hypothetical protein ENK07_02840, partial [Bacteroidetes bacterium]|nr:hypothetical protein [Bacteroidota bacterium]